MTTYLGEKAVGIGTIKATSSVSDVLHDNTLTGNGSTEPLGVNTDIIATKTELADQIGDISTALTAILGE